MLWRVLVASLGVRHFCFCFDWKGFGGTEPLFQVPPRRTQDGGIAQLVLKTGLGLRELFSSLVPFLAVGQCVCSPSFFLSSAISALSLSVSLTCSCELLRLSRFSRPDCLYSCIIRSRNFSLLL